jgi:MtN3 and saliva related transmembrane protein
MTLAIGLCAAALTITSFLAQAWKILRTRDVSSLSTPMWILSAVAFAVWTTYGVLLGEWPIIIPNALCLLLSGFILALQVMPPHKRDAIADAVAPQAG